MGIGKLIKKYLCVACVCFTLITAVYMLIMMITNPDPNEHAAAEAYRIVLFFIFSVCFAIANAILSIEKIYGAVRYLAHYAICAFAFYVCFLLPMNYPSRELIGVFLFTFFYVIVMAIVGIFRSKLKKNREATATYTKQFSKKK